MPAGNIEEALEDLRQGKLIIVVDDEDRENEGDLTLAAEKVTPEAINFMARHGRGLICLPLTGQRLDELQIPMMVADNSSSFGTAFTVSIEARRNITTGISASDRATTILTAIGPETRPNDLARPGHIFPLRARRGGVLARAGQTEAAVDLARIAGLYPAGVICEIMNEDGTMSRMPQLEEFAKEFDLTIITIADLIQYRLRTEKFVEEVSRSAVATAHGKFTAVVFQNRLDGRNHLALIRGDIGGEEPVDVRVQSQSPMGDVFLPKANPSGQYLQRCLRHIARRERGVILYLCVDPVGQRLLDEVRAYAENADVEDYSYAEEMFMREDPKDYGIGAQILNSLGLKKIAILTCHTRTFTALQGYGLEVVDQRDVDDDL